MCAGRDDERTHEYGEIFDKSVDVDVQHCMISARRQRFMAFRAYLMIEEVCARVVDNVDYGTCTSCIKIEILQIHSKTKGLGQPCYIRATVCAVDNDVHRPCSGDELSNLHASFQKHNLLVPNISLSMPDDSDEVSPMTWHCVAQSP